jgi:hypothetical protein
MPSQRRIDLGDIGDRGAAEPQSRKSVAVCRENVMRNEKF